MTHVSIAEKKALEDVFLCLSECEKKKYLVKKYFFLAKKRYCLTMKKLLPLIEIRRSYEFR